MLLGAACQATPKNERSRFASGETPLTAVSLQTTTLETAANCNGRFTAHILDHTTEVKGPNVHMFQTNGSGVAINDLDGNGYLDLVFANLHGPPSIFWNEGNLSFHTETLKDNGTRAVNIVDVDGDGRLDIVFTHVRSALSYWRNQLDESGNTSFEQGGLAKAYRLAHSMAWADLNGDQRLDLVTGSYDSELHLELGDAFLFGPGAGVFQYLQDENGQFVPEQLAEQSQALAIALIDLNDDGRRDIVVGNDFDVHDQTWIQGENGWEVAEPFANTTHSTMSLDWADVDNNGRYELFATDMNPYDISPENMARWLPMMEESMPMNMPNDDPQLSQNVLQVLGDDGSFANRAQRRGIVASGWSWSGKFGDLDNDSHLDLYIVNGMIDDQMFHYLPDGELVEENQAFRNDGSGSFLPAPDWAMAGTESGRGMSMADLDNDGDLDVVINNLTKPSMLLENGICGGKSVQVTLQWPDSGNSYALGAQVLLHTDSGTMLRDVRAGSGYLSGDPVRLHFGVADGTDLEALEIIWPDGAMSVVEEITADSLLAVTR
ncbi:MAG: CRTAC1 family protein [Chloroflexota bacterium]